MRCLHRKPVELVVCLTHAFMHAQAGIYSTMSLFRLQG